MINGTFRPSGKLPWLFRMPSIGHKNWFVIGCISTQDRCQSILLHANSSLRISRGGFLKIIDEPSPFSAQTTNRLLTIQDSVSKLLPPKSEIIEFDLLGALAPLKEAVKDWVRAASGSIILDISALPERFCFPILRWLLENADVRDLVITYMSPERYTTEELGYDPHDWGQLPTFVSEDISSGLSVEQVVVGVGFLPYSLPDWLKKTYDTPKFKFSLLFPFPAPPSSVSRAWEFVRRIEKDLSLREDRQIIRVAANDISGAYQRIFNLTKGGKVHAVFAPYGPKTHSIAMGLHALRHSCEVYFTQPTYYHPEYSTGIAFDHQLPAGHAFAIRVDGRDYY